MKIALLSDTHFGVHKNSEIFLKSQFSFIVDQFIPYLRSNNIKDIAILGDIFDNRSSVNIKVMNVVHDIFENYLKDFSIRVIVGNHDTYYTSSIEINSLKFLNNFPNVTLVERVTEIDLDGRKTVLVPWIIDNVEFIREFSKNSYDICLGHFNIYGFSFNKFKVSDDGIRDKLFDNCQKVFTGHFHIRNTRKYANSEIVYIGSPYQLSRADIDENRGFTILDTSTLEYLFVDNTHSLKYIKLKYPEAFSENTIKNNIIDVHIDYDNSYNENDIDKYVKIIEELHPVMPPNIFVDNNSEVNGSIDLNNYNIGSVMNLVREYVDSLDIGNKEEIYGILVELYNETKGDNL